MMINKFNGLGVALATPFTERKTNRNAQPAVDMAAFQRLIQHVLQGAADFLVLLGSTGEAATITEEERGLLIEVTKKEAGKTPLLVGTGHNSTSTACALSKQAADLGADGLLVVTPYYNKPQAEGLLAHYKAVAASAPALPLVLYNVPGRTALNMPVSVVQKLWEIPQAVAIKESSGDFDQMNQLLYKRPAGKTVLSGDDALALPSICLGAQGLVSVLANLYPAEMSRMVHAALQGDFERAQHLHSAYFPLMQAMFYETNPAPLKEALRIVQICENTLRLPLVSASHTTSTKLGVLLEERKGALVCQ